MVKLYNGSYGQVYNGSYGRAVQWKLWASCTVEAMGKLYSGSYGQAVQWKLTPALVSALVYLVSLWYAVPSCLGVNN